MASPIHYPSAFAPSGPDVISLSGNWLSGSVLWVDSATGNDANAGTEPELPKATWTSAYTAAAAGATILCAPGHVEVIAAAATLGTGRVTTVSLGIGSQRARFTSAVAGVMWTVTGTYQSFYSCYFAASTAATTARIAATTGGGLDIVGSYFECGANDTTNCLTYAVGASGCRIESCDFVSTASRPARAINITGATSDIRLIDVLVDGGSFGWSSPAIGVTAAATNLWLQNVRLANKSDIVFTTTGTTYKGFGVRTIDNTGSRIDIAA